jgi:hypothetical protein
MKQRKISRIAAVFGMFVVAALLFCAAGAFNAGGSSETGTSIAFAESSQVAKQSLVISDVAQPGVTSSGSHAVSSHSQNASSTSNDSAGDSETRASDTPLVYAICFIVLGISVTVVIRETRRRDKDETDHSIGRHHA